ncbi:NADH-ubiquinone oxidoreductase subunit NDUFA12 family protein [Rickettsiales endosymbiont of Stachyamoeba lipophora]|uniref:NADH-ubiquinone oxidoreductase subunit NDUFA12 family protein n=1 Tax=Rickettsiales endosymbiont of Stachyamoeba lipophora TaxID=2486578 RepID=UPI000F6499B5|nr:NADH-ubiquinone oxidoreductase subunit NDUFA12 family protein [Rickettsiales endosymbiont of Stachyamoeba lipophora]AZL16028.1 NADH:ubiquinone oxidoreductase subunit NDUFA12 [Rickettsiales endosymbiont of Stachyamoeba lipophora]
MIKLGTLISVWLFYKPIGTDQVGNKYYLSKIKDSENKYRRTVIYNGLVEPTKIPPMWHAWLHYLTDEIPSKVQQYSWQQDPMPNLTGTDMAYRPPGHIANGGQRPKVTGDYEAWDPNA